MQGSPQLQLWRLHGARAQRVVVGSDIDDTLISSGGWMFGSSYLGGVDSRYPRGASYPGLSVLMYLLSLGPHDPAAPTTHKTAPPTPMPKQDPLPLALISARPSIPLFRPSMLYQHMSAICANGARQATGDPKATWKAGNENRVMLSSLRSEALLAEEKLDFLLNLSASNEANGVHENDDGHVGSDDTVLVFFGDTGYKDIETMIGMAVIGGRFIGGFLHLVHAGEEGPVPFARNSRTRKMIEGIQKFGIEYRGRVLEAVQLAFSVRMTRKESSPDQSCDCKQLSRSEAFAVATLIGDKVRDLLRLYSVRWVRSRDTFKASNYADPIVPVIFIKCHRVYMKQAKQIPLTASRRLLSSGAEVSVHFRARAPVDPQDLGVPIMPYRTAVAASTQALVLGLISHQEAVRVAQTALKELRAQGPITHSDWLPALLDHFYEARALLWVLQAPYRLETDMDLMHKRMQALVTELASLVVRSQSVAQAPLRDEECAEHWQKRLHSDVPFQWEFQAFSRMFILFFCKFDLQINNLQDAGAEEVEHLASALGQAVLEGLAICSELVELTGEDKLPETVFDGINVSPPDYDIEKDSSEQCTWRGRSPTASVFNLFFKRLCAELPKFVCTILRQRLLEEGFLAELAIVVEWRASGATLPLRLHAFDLVLPPPSERTS
ncbi:hypothetical protein cyc_05566 [Cyclospora cayetanensis]|uniref:Uncharacterized protein n=1 Tax=Cyclospora cayetanensis TaxID=88456 RepID=A0A1D3D3V1_9EIME|nr:hypothetical protein cyc_05566 [Cyclospora cayetanensis]